MPANTAPLFPITPNLGGFVRLTAANTATDGTGTAPAIFTAGAFGSRLDKVKCRAGGTNAATVLRLFLNNGSTSATAANNTLYAEVLLPATSASAVAEMGPDIEVPFDLSLPAGYKVLACLATAVAGGWSITPVGGDY